MTATTPPGSVTVVEPPATRDTARSRRLGGPRQCAPLAGAKRPRATRGAGRGQPSTTPWRTRPRQGRRWQELPLVCTGTLVCGTVADQQRRIDAPEATRSQL